MILVLNRLSGINNLALRIITAFVGAVIVITSIIYSFWTYFAIFFLICLFSILEFYKLVGVDGMLPLKTWGTLTGLVAYTTTFLVEAGFIEAKYFFVIFPLLFLVFFIKLYRKTDKKPFTNIAFTFLGILYVAVPFSLLHVVAFCKESYGFEVILGVFLINWANDTGAFFAGTKFGKTKLFKRISPKKTWEGFIGGMLLSLAMTIGLIYYTEQFQFWQWLVIGTIVVVAGTYGDLVESLFKRSILIKDSGAALPGHGGFLDRFDALMYSLPFIAVFLKLF
jgi:phosphatidate cytidylyltransferase